MRWLLALAAIAALAAFLLHGNDDDAASRASGTHADTKTPETTPRQRAEEPAAEPDAPAPETDESSDGKKAWDVRLTVAVVAAETQAPIADAEVYVLRKYEAGVGRSGRTDAAGLVTLDAPEDLGLVVVRAPGRVTQQVDHPERETEHRMDVALVAGTPLRGRVVRAPGGEPVAGAEVYAWNASTEAEIDFDPPLFLGDDSSGVRTDADGRFAFAAAPPDADVVLAARAPGLATVSRTIAAGSASAEVTLELGGGAVIEGVVRDAQGRPVESADVYAVPRGDDSILMIPTERWLADRRQVRLTPCDVTDGDGRYRIAGLATPAGYVVTVARKRWDRGLAEPVVLQTPGASETRDVVVFENAWIHGKLVGPDGSPLEFDGFELFTPDGRPYVNPFANGSSSQGDTFSSSAVVPGEYVVEVSTEAPFPPVRQRVVVAGGGKTEAVFRFAAGGTLTGVVIDADGAPAEGVTVWAGGHHEDTTADGSFRIEGVPASPIDVQFTDDRNRFVPRVVAAVKAPDGPLRVTLTRGPEFVFDVGATVTEVEQVLCSGRSVERTFDRLLQRETDRLFHLRGVAPGERIDVTIRVDGDSAPFIRRDLVGDAGQRVNLGTLELRPARVIRGVVLQPDGSPAAGARVEVMDRRASRSGIAMDQGVHNHVVANSNGEFEVRGAPTGDLLVAAEFPGAARTFRLIGRDGEPPIRLDAGVEVVGRVSDASGDPACAAYVVIRATGEAGASPSSPAWTAETDTLGEFRVRLPSGEFVVDGRRTWRGDYTPMTGNDGRPAVFEVKGPGPVHVDARLR